MARSVRSDRKRAAVPSACCCRAAALLNTTEPAMPGPEGDAMQVCTSTKGVRAVRRRTAAAPDYGRVSAAGRWWCTPLPVLQGGRRRGPASLQAPHDTAQAHPLDHIAIYGLTSSQYEGELHTLECVPFRAAHAEHPCRAGRQVMLVKAALWQNSAGNDVAVEARWAHGY